MPTSIPPAVLTPLAGPAEPHVRAAENESAVGERSYQRLAVEIVSLIEKGEVRIDDRLPSERTLAERFMVSHPAVREATIALEIRGIVEVAAAPAFTSAE